MEIIIIIISRSNNRSSLMFGANIVNMLTHSPNEQLSFKRCPDKMPLDKMPPTGEFVFSSSNTVSVCLHLM